MTRFPPLEKTRIGSPFSSVAGVPGSGSTDFGVAAALGAACAFRAAFFCLFGLACLLALAVFFLALLGYTGSAAFSVVSSSKLTVKIAACVA